MTDKQIRVFPVLDNLKLLHRYSGFQALTELHTVVVGLVKSTGLVKVAQLVNYLKVSAGEVLSVVARLLCLGLLVTFIVGLYILAERMKNKRASFSLLYARDKEQKWAFKRGSQ